ncbi:hypothetical protein HJG60_009760 [Phyllostomus discolor]|uniref:Uncharacterized protein n=1 Tax=Phyllostomus discolor TaxID=89673 RepID=A0A834BCI0_9CHIR|nr:hypothetical protein HJG60_009760 [Phyllostomus discolor]
MDIILNVLDISLCQQIYRQATFSGELIDQGEDDSSISGLVLKQWEKYHIKKSNFQMQLNLHLTQQPHFWLCTHKDILAMCYFMYLEAHHSFVFLGVLFCFVFPLIFLGHKHTAPASCLLMLLCHLM